MYLHHFFRSVRRVQKGDLDKLISDEKVEKELYKLFSALHHSHINLSEVFQHEDFQSRKRPRPNSQNLNEPRVEIETLLKQQYGDKDISAKNIVTMYEVMGFSIERRPSIIPNGGRGVVVTRGHIPKGSVVAMYPGRHLHS